VRGTFEASELLYGIESIFCKAAMARSVSPMRAAHGRTSEERSAYVVGGKRRRRQRRVESCAPPPPWTRSLSSTSRDRGRESRWLGNSPLNTVTKMDSRRCTLRP